MPTEPQRIVLSSNFSADAGGLKNVSLMTTGIEAAGHGLYLDEKTAGTVMSKLLGRSVKSYLQHKGAGGDRLGQEIGFFSGIYRQGAQIKATAFEFLDSFKKEAGNTCDKIVEMAQKVPDQFGVSLVLSYLPVWVMPDGSEVACSGLSAPKGAIREIPSMRVLDVISADFVGSPAANPNGLLSVPVDAPPKEEAKPTEPMTQVLTLSQEQHDAALAELSTGHALALSALEAKLTEANAAHVVLLASKDEAHNKAVKELSEQHFAALAEKDKAILTAENQSASKLGIPPLVLNLAALQVSQIPAPGKSDAEKWAQYAELKATDSAKAETFYLAHLARK